MNIVDSKNPLLNVLLQVNDLFSSVECIECRLCRFRLFIVNGFTMRMHHINVCIAVKGLKQCLWF